MRTPSPSTPEASPSSREPVACASKIAGFTLAGLLAAGLLCCLLLLSSGKVGLSPAGMSRDDLLHGELTHKIARQLSEAWLPERAAQLERGASWILFKDTGARVRQGCDGWLFLSDELLVNHQARRNADIKADAVIGIRQKLAARGIALLIAVVPDKSRIVAGQLCGLRRPAALAPRASDWIVALHRAGVPAVNLASSLEPLGASAYLRTDTHWSEAGARIAAQAIAAQVREMGIRPVPEKVFDAHVRTARRPGDLVHLAGIDWLPLQWQPAPETVAMTEMTERQEASAGGDDLDDLLGDGNLPNIALIGTSFSRNSNFAGFLQQALGARIGSFAKDGGEFSASAGDYFSNPAFRQTPPQLVIWEIPERDLQTAFVPIRGIWPQGR